MLFIEMLGIIKYGERKLEKIVGFYYIFFFVSYLCMYFILKEIFIVFM